MPEAPLFDLPLEELRRYRCAAPPPPDLDAFWERAMVEARAAAVEPALQPYEPGTYRALEAFDVTFSGACGHPIRAWYLRPRGGGAERLPCVVGFVGYGGGRDVPAAHAVYPACGYAAFVMDTRAQGG